MPAQRKTVTPRGAAARDPMEPPSPAPSSTPAIWVCLAGLGLCLGAFVGLLYRGRYVQPYQTDDLIYHLTIPAYWLQNGWFTPFTSWFHEPAPGYSPLFGEVLMTLLMAPFHTDIAARFVQLPFQLGVAIMVYALLRRIDVERPIALLSAAGAVLFRPLLLQTFSCHNDVILTFFFLVAVWGILNGPIRSRVNGATFAFATGIGGMLATKYVAVPYVAVLVAFALACSFRGMGGVLDTPSVRRGRTVLNIAAWALCLVIVAAGCWTYIRNVIQTGNPLYPADINIFGWTLFRGLYDVNSIADFKITPVTIWRLFLSDTEAYSLPKLTGSICITSIITICIAASTSTQRFSFAKFLLVLWFPAACTGAFLCVSPFGEQRLLFPVYALLWLAPPILIQEFRDRNRLTALAGACIMLGIDGILLWEGPARLNMPSALGLMLLLPGLAWIGRRIPWRQRRRVAVYGSIAAILALLAWVYVKWEAYSIAYLQNRSYASRYGALGQAWDVLADTTRDEPAVVAHTGTSMIYPLFGPRLANQPVYVHIAPQNHKQFHEYDHHIQSMRTAPAIQFSNEVFRAKQDRDYWLQSMDSLRPTYLFIAMTNPDEPAPIENRWASEAPERFELVCETDSARIYRYVPATESDQVPD